LYPKYNDDIAIVGPKKLNILSRISLFDIISNDIYLISIINNKIKII
jgi:hypothetical protein